MRVITDDHGLKWNVSVITSAVQRVRGALGFDLLDLVDGEKLHKLYSDLALAVDVYYYLCLEQAQAQKIGLDAFRDRWSGDRIEAATNTVIEELADFFPKRRKDMLLAMRTSHDAMVETLIEALLAKADPTSSAASSGATPGSSDSTPALSPAANSNG